MRSRRGAAALLATAAVVFGACSSGGASTAPSAAAPTTAASAAAPSTAASAAPSAAAAVINWYHIQNNDPGKALWQKLADEYTAAHPNVKINLTVLENEAFKTKLTTLLQAGTPPDLFQSWGGGGLREQQKAGLVKDISADVSSWASEINPGALGMYQVDGKQYGIPFDLGMVGFWYNKAQSRPRQQPGTISWPTSESSRPRS
jgi:raffinose/stachyose/melibiose transport system substrate-binding protein